MLLAFQEGAAMSHNIRIGTYNTNNLFDRFDDPYNYGDDPWQRAFASRPKPLSELYELGARLRGSDLDILALQEVESLDALREFIHGHVGPAYKLNGVISFESNDPRGIDLGVVSKLPLGRVTSHRFRRDAGAPVFSRDCLQVEVLYPGRDEVLLTMFVCHLKSKYSTYVPGTAAYVEDQQKSIQKRTRQVAHTIEIIRACQDVDRDRFVVLGDMNDTPDAPALQEFLRLDNPLKLHNALASIPQTDNAPDSTQRRPRDTHKWSKDVQSGHLETTYSQLDYILLSSALARAFTGSAKVEQRINTAGSDHYLSWAEVDLDLL
jgi:endonuclease/exonuclease/phosphatase family metal-dependent hydrolase